MISMKYYIAKRRQRYFISWDTFDTAKIIYIYINGDWERDKQIWDWQFHDINEILYRQRKKTIFLIMRYFQNSKNDIYIYKWRLRERQSNLRVAISWYQWYIISPKEEDDISYHEIHPKQKKWYIFIYMKIETETIQYEIGNFKISMKYYVAKRRNRYFISWDTSKTAKPIYIYIYMKLKIERETNKYEIGNSMISMKYYIAKKKRRYFISWDTSKTAKTIYIHINEVRERDNEVWEWQFHDINEILKSTIFPIMRYTQKRKKWYVYIYIW